jgi:hypothetical protein
MEGVFSDASLSGLYHLALIFYNNSSQLDVTHYGTLTFDGAGAAAGTVDRNAGGSILAGVAVGGTYVVSPSGKLTFNYVGMEYAGGMLEDGDLVILAGSRDAGDLPSLMVLVRGSVAASLATLSGAYHVVALSATAGMASVPAWGALTTTASSDGAGTITFADGTLNTDGVISVISGGALGYTVMADGTLDLATGEPTTGGVSPAGDFAVLGGGTGSGDAPILWFLMR